MKIEATTKMTYEVYKKYSSFNLTKGKWYKNPVIFMPVLILLSLINIILQPENQTLIILLIILIVAEIAMIFLVNYAPKKYYKSVEKMFETPSNYTFFDDHIEIISGNPMVSGTSNCKYDLIYKVYEVKDCFYIYISTVQAYIIPKADITEGTAEQLRALLQSRVERKKYKVCYKG